MHIVKFQGGLGNQMFQYALYRKFQMLGFETYADLRTYKKLQEKRNLDILKFNVRLKETSEKNIIKLAGKDENKIDWAIRRIFPKTTYINEKEIYYNSKIFEMKNGYYNGYWQSEKYFLDIRNILLEEFSFYKYNAIKSNEYADKIRNSEAVSIHIRLGDYLQANTMYGGICTKKYYEEAILKITENYKDAIFYIFSNDIEMAKDMLAQNEKFIYVDEYTEKDGFIDMYLMSLCKHNIIANSSFSWWAAWLNQNDGKMVISPSRWLNNQEIKDIWCDNWIKI